MRFFNAFLPLVRPTNLTSGQPFVGRPTARVHKLQRARLSVVCNLDAMGGLRRRVHAHLVGAGFEVAQTDIHIAADATSAIACFTVRFSDGHAPALMQSAHQIRSDRAARDVVHNPPRRQVSPCAIKQ